MSAQDITGQRFGKLIALERVGTDKWRNTIWLFKCDCGKLATTLKCTVIRGDTQSCGCLENPGQYKPTHGMNGTRFYGIWLQIVGRTGNMKDSRYGGRGIKCLWTSFEEFRDDMYESYLEHVDVFGEKRTQIDREDNNGHYSKDNCRWVTPVQNASNRRSNVIVYFEGKKMTLKQAATLAQKDYQKVWDRINKHGWSVDRALKT